MGEVDNEEDPFPPLSRRRSDEGSGEKEKKKEEDGTDGRRRERSRRRKMGEREAVISVGRAGCIRSNIMQAHTDSPLLSSALDPLDPASPRSPPLPPPPPPPPSSTRCTAYTQNIRPRVQGNGSTRRGLASVMCVGLRFSRAARARVPSIHGARECMCVYGLPYLHRNRGSIEPRKWP